MNYRNLTEVNLIGVLPQNIKDSVICYTRINSKVFSVVDEAPDIATCHTNGYLYELKNKKILKSLNLQDNPLSVSCYYLSDGKKLIIFYLVYTASNRLLVIQRTTKHLKVVKEFSEVSEFQIYDFKCLGFPQIKITFMSKSESSICEFPLESHIEKKSCEFENSFSNFLADEFEDLFTYCDTLTEEYSHLKKICFHNNMATDIERITVKSPNFSLGFNNSMNKKLLVSNKWFKVFGSSLVLGMTLRNICNETIDDLEIIINHKEIKDYVFSFFRSSCDVSRYLFSSNRFNGFLKPDEEICAVGSFEIPKFYTRSDLCLLCYVTSKNLKDSLLKETFEIGVREIALQTTVDLEEHFTIEILLAIMAVKSETHIEIHTEDLGVDLMESLFTKNLGFKLINHVKDKLFYCTSTYLKEVFVALKRISVNLWKMVLFTDEERQIYFLVNALYDLLPENSGILYDKNAE